MCGSGIRTMHQALTDPIVEASGLEIQLGGKGILQDICFSVLTGQRVAVLGRSGAGKSTLLRSLVGMPLPSDGTLEIFGQDSKSYSKRGLQLARQKIAHISQGYDLVDELSSLENVLLGSFAKFRFPRLWKWSYPKKTIEHGIQLLRDFDLSDQIDQPAGSLSGGQRQRVAIARALISSPSMLIADEPVSALDAHTSKQVLADLKEVANQGVAVVAAMHQVDLAIDWATHLLVLSEGRIIDSGESSRFNPAEVTELIGKPEEGH